MISPALIAKAAEEVCHKLNLSADVERVIALVVEVASGPSHRLDGLSPSETRLVNILRRVSGRPVATGSLLELADFPTEATLKVHVCRVRKKRPDLGTYIETVHSVGYRWTGAAFDH